MGCFRPAIPLNFQPDYPVDVFFANQTRPEAHYVDLKWLEFRGSIDPIVPLSLSDQTISRRINLTCAVHGEFRTSSPAKAKLQLKALKRIRAGQKGSFIGFRAGLSRHR